MQGVSAKVGQFWNCYQFRKIRPSFVIFGIWTPWETSLYEIIGNFFPTQIFYVREAVPSNKLKVVCARNIQAPIVIWLDGRKLCCVSMQLQYKTSLDLLQFKPLNPLAPTARYIGSELSKRQNKTTTKTEQNNNKDRTKQQQRQNKEHNYSLLFTITIITVKFLMWR